jgi:regulator of sigma D
MTTIPQGAIAEYLNDRQKLIVLLMKLTSATEDRSGDVAETLRIRLCEKVVDYLSTGYFRIYGNLLATQTWLEPRAYASFEATTATVLAFNDGFATPGPVAHTRFKNALAELALALETRFELEDRLFARLKADAVERPAPCLHSPVGRVRRERTTARQPALGIVFATT